MMSCSQLEIDRFDLHRSRLTAIPLLPLADGYIRLRVESFALTANTVTYAVAGDMLGYWDFFPAHEAGWGRVPAMGWGELIESRIPELAVGARYYGWFPMASHVDFQAGVTSLGFRDDGVHRQAHAPVYRAFTDARRDPLYQSGADAEARQALLRGLFQTAFLADDALAEQQDYGAARVLILSASSKTALALAELIRRRGGPELVGVTSARNLDFVARQSCFGAVLAYDELGELNPSLATGIVDMAGNTAVLARLHAQLGGSLKFSMAIGRSHHDAPRVPVAGPVQPQFFFAPRQASKRIAQWGAAEFSARVAVGLEQFVGQSRNWLSIETVLGPESVQHAWEQLLAGQVDPSRGLVASLS